MLSTDKTNKQRRQETMKPCKFWRTAAVSLSALTLALTAQAQNLTNPCPNRVISWNANNGYGNINPTDLAGLAPAINWVDISLNDITTGLPDNAGNTTTLDLGRGFFNVSAMPWPVASDPGLDADGTANKRMLNVYLNAGPAGWNPPVTNTYVSLTNIPYARYDVVVYFIADASGRHGSIDNGSGTTYSFSTVGIAARSGANALFLPTTETNSAIFPAADFAFFPGMTAPNAIFTEMPKSGMEQWLGIAAFQLIESSNVYVLYGPAPATQVIPVGQPASFSVMAGGLNPTYQWRHAGINIPNATNATYTIASTAAGQDGDYEVVVSNGFSSMTSTVATLTFYAPKSLEWAGNNSVWDTTTAAWTTNNGASTLAYIETDNVRLGPLGSAQSTVTLSATHTPSAFVVSNGTYTLVSGSLAGSGSLHLKNNATLILDTIDTRSGWTLIDSGCTFQLDNGDTAGSMGAGALTNNGALVFNAAGDEAYGYPVYGTGSITNIGPSGTLTLGNTLNANYLAQAGSGTLLLQGNNNLAGGTVISAGTVWARSGGAFGSAPILVTGGELQLHFNFDYTEAPLTLSGGSLHGGVGGSQIFEGPVTLTTDSTITIDGGNSLTLPNAAGLAGNGFNLTVSGGGTLILAGTNNTWASVNIAGDTLQIGNGGATGSLGAGTIQDDGVLAFNLAGNLVVTNFISGAGTINKDGSGIVTLTADINASGFSGAINVTNGTLLVNGTSGSGPVTVAGGSLGGTGTIGGPVSVLPGGTLSPGASVGTLTINSDLELSGNLAIDVTKSPSLSCDLTVVIGALNNTGTGSVVVKNLGPALTVGDSFKLFNKLMAGGETLVVTGGGAVWNNKLAVDGTIQVASIVEVPQPVITSVSLAGSANLVFSGTNGSPGSTYDVLSSTNVVLPLTNWTHEATGYFSATGSFSVTNSISSGVPQKFYRLLLP
jgi:autotransporter-associated beta strand protein